MSFSISSENFAKLFRPKASLFNKISELIIDELQYISFPCPCSEELSSDISTTTDSITLFNVVVVAVRESAMNKLREKRLLQSSDYTYNNSVNQNNNTSSYNNSGVDPVAIAMGLAGKVTHANSIKRYF